LNFLPKYEENKIITNRTRKLFKIDVAITKLPGCNHPKLIELNASMNAISILFVFKNNLSKKKINLKIINVNIHEKRNPK
jgi:hypothetical protein